MEIIIFICGAFLILWSIKNLVLLFVHCFTKMRGMGGFMFGTLLPGSFFCLASFCASTFAVISDHWWMLIVGFLINSNIGFLTNAPKTWFLLFTDKELKSTVNHIAAETGRLSIVLGKDPDQSDFADMMQHMGQHEKALHDLYNLCMYDPVLRSCMEEYDADEKTIRKIYSHLCINGLAGWMKTGWTKHTFVPVAAFTTPRVLVFLLREQELPYPLQSAIVTDYFRGKTQALDAYNSAAIDAYKSTSHK